MIAGTHCFQHCGACLDTCPAGVPVHDVLRHRMYFEDYGDEKQAMQGYAKLDVDASACLNCAAPCVGGCPEGIPIQERMLGAHQMLTLS
jgi:ferredoxin